MRAQWRNQTLYVGAVELYMGSNKACHWPLNYFAPYPEHAALQAIKDKTVDSPWREVTA